jgi:hypothetical protein
MPNSKKKNSGSGAKLLSVGNPRIPKGEGDEPAWIEQAATCPARRSRAGGHRRPRPTTTLD